MPAVLITGADRGLGFSLVEGFLAGGWKVFAGKFLAEYGFLDELAARDPNLTILPLDVSSEASIQAARDLFAEKPEVLDMIISNAAYMGGPQSSGLKGPLPIDYDLMEYSFRTNALGALKVMELFLPFTEGGKKRLCFVSSECSSVTMMHRDSGFRYTMTKTALNVAARTLYNRLFPMGYTFRMYHPGWMKHVNPDGSRNEDGADLDPNFSRDEAMRQFLTDRPDEQRLVLVDYMGCEWAY